MNPSISLVLSRTFPAILTKSECYALYHNDLFGNKVQTWKTVEDIYSSGWNKRVCIRGKQKGISRSATRYNVPLSELESTIQEMGLEGIPKENLTFNQEMPDPHLTIQGELILTYRGIDLTYTDIKKPMNLALAEKTLWASGLSALNLIKSNFWETSYSDFQELLQTFEGPPNSESSVIEFSAYDTGVGDIPGRNVVFWEVRNY